MTHTLPRTAVLEPAAMPAFWAAAEPVTCPIPIIDAQTSPIPVIRDRPGPGVGPDAQHARQAAVLTGLVGLVLLVALLLALGIL